MPASIERFFSNGWPPFWNLLILVAMVIVGIVIVRLFIATVIRCLFLQVGEKQAAIISRFGKFVRVARSGLTLRLPWEKKEATLSMQKLTKEVKVESRSSDDVSGAFTLMIEISVAEGKEHLAYYESDSPENRLQSLVKGSLGALATMMTREQIDTARIALGAQVADMLKARMLEYGYSVYNAELVEIIWDKQVVEARNRINAAQAEAQVKRTLAAAEADRVRALGHAQAEAAAGHDREVLATAVDTLRKQFPSLSEAQLLEVAKQLSNNATLRSLGPNTNVLVVK